MSPIEPLQRAVYGLLASSTALTNAGGRVYDAVPEGAVMPYVVLGEFDAITDDTHTGLGDLVTVVVHAWSDYRGYREAARCMDAVIGALHRARPEVDGYTDVSLLHESTQYQRDPDPNLRHAIGRFTARLTEDTTTTSEVV